MRKVLVSMMAVCLAVVVLSGCATSEERAAQKAEHARKVQAALNQKDFKISVDRMYPMRGSSKNVSYGYLVGVRNDSLFSHLPYFGRAFSVPYGGGKGLNFEERIGSYKEYQKKNGKRYIEIEVKNEEDSYLYTIEVFDDGKSSVDVQARQRERISYSGEMEFDM
jgi:hypothetical protein